MKCGRTPEEPVVPDHLRRYPTQVGRLRLAERLGLHVDPLSQDWEWEVAQPQCFPSWAAVYHNDELTDDERFSLMEMLVQCIEDMTRDDDFPDEIEASPAWQTIAALLRANARLHVSTIFYWCVFACEKPDEVFRVSLAMRRVWAEIRSAIA